MIMMILGPFLLDDTIVTTCARSAKNRTSTLSPSHQQQQQQTSTRTTSWCSSSSSAVSTAVSPTTISSRSASSEAHPSSLLRVHPVSVEKFAAPSAAVSSSSRGQCCQVNGLKPPLCRPVTRTVSKYEVPREDQLPRRRSLSTEEEIRSIGCFNLRQSLPVNNNNNNTKSKVGQLSNRAKTLAEKPTWLQICDPCHRMLERSLTPDLSDIVLLQQRISSNNNNNNICEKNKSVDLQLADLRFIDSSAGDLHNWQDAHGNRRLSNGRASNSSIEWEPVSRGYRIESSAGDHREKRNGPVNNINREYLCKQGNSVDEIIINNKLFRRFREPPTSLLRPEDLVDEKASSGGGVSRDDDDDVANNNLGEKERRRIASELSSRNGVTAAVAVATDRRHYLSPEAESRKARLSAAEQQSCENGDSGRSAGDCEKDLNGDGRTTVFVAGAVCQQRDSFEEDYERCIESINRQLKLESRDAANRRTTTGQDDNNNNDVTLFKPDLKLTAGSREQQQQNYQRVEQEEEVN